MTVLFFVLIKFKSLVTVNNHERQLDSESNSALLNWERIKAGKKTQYQFWGNYIEKNESYWAYHLMSDTYQDTNTRKLVLQNLIENQSIWFCYISCTRKIFPWPNWIPRKKVHALVFICCFLEIMNRKK